MCCRMDNPVNLCWDEPCNSTMLTPNALCISTLGPYDDLSINGLQSTNLAPHVREMAKDRDDSR
jgi:hypothetical protein